jgi:2'-5' RNA ligase
MPKLFVAIALPDATACELARLRPLPMTGVRLVEPAQMHLTLHFIGEAEVDPMANALQGVAVHAFQHAFQLAFEGVGQFPSAGGAVTLWAGVRKSADLLALHSALADALAGQGLHPESRPYAPHVTLARCEPTVPASVVDEFLSSHCEISVSPMTVAQFGLYSSNLVGVGPVYRCERSFPLSAPQGSWTLHRQDDNGNRFVMQSGLSREEAERQVALFESRGHKQRYWAEQEAH